MSRFHLPAPAWDSPRPGLDEAETRHALDVLRLGVGSKLTVFDGRGREAIARIAAVEGGVALLEIGLATRSPRLPCEVTLAQAIPKGKNMDLIIQKAVELGVWRLAPLCSERTVVRLEEDDAAKKCERWREIALEACKQCGQNHLPEIGMPMTPARFLDGSFRAELMLIASLQPDARRIKAVLAGHVEAGGRPPSSVAVLVGPEGDFTPAETALAKSFGCLPITLGPIVLRSETAAIYCLSVLGHELFG